MFCFILGKETNVISSTAGKESRNLFTVSMLSLKIKGKMAVGFLFSRGERVLFSAFSYLGVQGEYMKCWEKINKLIAPLSSPSGCVSPEAPALNSLRDYNVQSDSKPWKGTMQKDPC